VTRQKSKLLTGARPDAGESLGLRRGRCILLADLGAEQTAAPAKTFRFVNMRQELICREAMIALDRKK